MIRVLQSLPNKVYRAVYGGVRAQKAKNPHDSNQEKHGQDGVGLSASQNPACRVSLHTSKWSDGIGGKDKHNERGDDWEKSFKRRLAWDTFKGSNYVQEAVGWGSIIVLGLQLGRYFNEGTPGDNQRRQQNRVLPSLTHVLQGYTLLRPGSSKRSVLPENLDERGSRPPESKNTSGREEKPSSPGSEGSVLWECESTDGQSMGACYQDTPLPINPSDTKPPSGQSFASLSSYSSASLTSVNSSASVSSGSSSAASLGSISTSHTSNPDGTSSTSDKAAATDDFLPTGGDARTSLDRVTKQCWGQVNNIIGGHLAVEGEESKAAEHFLLASEAGYEKGQYNMGMCYELGKGVSQDDEKAATYFSMAARQGHPYAQYKLGAYHLEGRGNMRQCQKRALQLITQAASGGVIQAQTYLGMYYMTSDEEDPGKAVVYLKAAAIEKDPEAEYHLGLCYEFGWGVEANTARAAKLYHSAATRHHPEALFAMGLFYLDGIGGLPENECQARELFTKANSLGCDKASDKLSEMDSGLSERSLYTPGSDASLNWASNTTLSSMSSSWSLSGSDAGSTWGLSDSDAGSTWSLSESDIGSSSPLLAPPTRRQGGPLPPSCSEPQLTSRRSGSTSSVSAGVNAEGAHSGSLLYSLSCLDLVFPRLQEGWTISSDSDGRAGRAWTISGTNGAVPDPLSPAGEAARAGAVSSHPRSPTRVRFNIGGGEEEADALDWCDPIDAMAQKRLVYRHTAACV